MSNVFASTHPLVQHKLSRLRDIKTEPKKFRELVREIAALLAYEATADLTVVPRELDTPLAHLVGAELQEKIGLVPILRAGLGGEENQVRRSDRSARRYQSDAGSASRYSDLPRCN